MFRQIIYMCLLLLSAWLVVDSSTAQQTTFGVGNYLKVIAGTGSTVYNGDYMLASSATLNSPSSVAFLESTGEILISDTSNHRIRKILTNGTITTIAGTGSAGYNGDNILATNAQLYYPYDIAVSQLSEIIIAEFGNRIRKILTNGTITTIAGTSVGDGAYNGDFIPSTSANVKNPNAVAISQLGEVIIAGRFIVDLLTVFNLERYWK